MKKTLYFGAVLTATAVAGFIAFKQPIKDAAYWVYAQGMFVTNDNDEFSPGSQVGDKFPSIKAMYENRKITSLEGFEGEKGTVFVAIAGSK